MDPTRYEHKGITILIEEHGSDLFHIRVVRPDHSSKVYWLTLAQNYRNCASLARYYYKRCIEGIDDPAWLGKALKVLKGAEPHTKAGFIEWLAERDFQEVGPMGTMGDTPMKRYIKETRETWKVSSFLIDGVWTNRPRWMDRFSNFCEEQLPDEAALGHWVRYLLREEDWDISRYDWEHHYEWMMNGRYADDNV